MRGGAGPTRCRPLSQPANQKMIENSDQSAGQTRTTVVSVAAAALLVVLKLGTGLVSGSLGLVSAGIESSGDVVAALLTLLAVRLAIRPADEDHPYGHRRAENLAALGEAAILAGGGSVVVARRSTALPVRGILLDALVRVCCHRCRAGSGRQPGAGFCQVGREVPVGGAALKRFSLRR